MPDVRIDQSPDIQSVRLRIPTGTVPIPPAGYAQLHSPSPGTLALRLPDGSVVELGGGGGGTPGVLSGTGGVVEAISNPFTGAGVTISPAAGETIFLNGPVVGPGPDQPFGVQVAPFTITSAELLALHTTTKVLVAAQGVGRAVWPLSLVMRYVPGLTAYTDATGASLVVFPPGQFGSGGYVAQLYVADLTGLVGAVISGILNAQDYFASVVDNAPLLAQLSGPVTLGDGSLVGAIAYLVV